MLKPVLPQSVRAIMIIGLGFVFQHMAFADKTVDLYTADVLVINQTAEVRNQAAVNELAKVFVRMSGSRAVLQNPKVRGAISNAGRYVDQFSYQSTDQEITLVGTTYPASLLSLQFIASPLENILREEQLPFWPTNRPEVLIWMAENTGRQRYVEKDSDMGVALTAAARSRGLPVVKPILDLQDRNNLPVPKIWAADERSIVQAAERYGVDAVVSGRIRRESNNFVANFILNHQGQSQYLQATARDRQALAEDMMAQVADFFANIYAVTIGNGDQLSERFQLLVNNANGFSVYAQVIQYLQKVKLLEASKLVSVDDEELIFDIRFNGNVPQLQQTFALDNKLVFLEQKTVYETVITPVVEESIPVVEESIIDPLTVDDTVGLDTGLDLNTGDTQNTQPTPLPPIQEDRPIQQLVFYWQ